MKNLLIIIMSAVVLLTACENDTQVHKPAIRFAIAQAPLNLDPRYATDAASERVNRLLYQRLVEFDQHAKPVPGIASWEVLSPTHYRFTLKPDIPNFYHGKALTAEDVKVTYESFTQLMDAPHAAEYANISEINVVNLKTVEFKLSNPDVHFPSKMIIGILPKDLIEQGHDFTHLPIGNGPFKFDNWDGDLTIQRVKDGQTIRFLQVKDPTVRVLKLMRGEVDLLQGDLPPELVDYSNKQSDVKVVTTLGTNYSYLGLNMQDPVLGKRKVRQALAYAINRQAIIDKVMVEKTRLATAILPPEHYAGNAALKPYPYRPQLARHLLREAGVNMPLKLVYKTSTDPQRVRLATILQAQLAKVGVKLEIRSLDWGTFFDEVKKGKFQLYGLTWVGIKTPEIYAKVFASTATPPNGFNRGRYTDRTLDKLLPTEDWKAVTDRVHRQLPYIPLWYEGQSAAMRHHITGYQPQADGNWDGLIDVMYKDALENNAASGGES